MNRNNINMWNVFTLPLQNNLISSYQIEIAIDKFYRDVFSNLDNDKFLLVIFRIKTIDNLHRNISTIQRVNKNDINKLKDVILAYWKLKSENYNQEALLDLIINYKLIDNKFNIVKSKLNKPNKKVHRSKLLKFGSFKLPQTMDLYEWGDVQFILNDTEAMVLKFKSHAQYHIKFKDNNTMYVDYIVKDHVILSFVDELNDKSNLGTFTRTIKNQKFKFINGILDFKEKTFILPKITKLKKAPFLKNEIITMDIETRNIGGVLSPYTISYYDGDVCKSFYLTDYLDSRMMLISCIKSLMKRKYHGKKIYIHNFSNFDVVFLFNVLCELSEDIKPIINDGNFIDIKFKFFSGKYKLYFRDSLLMLPSSLRKLTKSFDVEDKGIFPYRFVSQSNLDYDGNVPDYEYFDGLTTSQYQEYCLEYTDRKWNLRSETIKYCEQDCKALYQLLIKFYTQNFIDTRVNGSDSLSLPSLAFKNFRTNFLKTSSYIPKIKGEIYHFIKDGYYGGAVDVYKPYGRNIYRYDVNSLYPYIMKNNPMPVGNPILIEGNSSKIESIIKDLNKISFVEVEVTCPDTIKAPLLLHKINGKTIAPTGQWNGVYTSMEINRALELGYSFIYNKALYFDSEILFDKYVDFYYDMKKNSEKNSSTYTISKLMLNSLYGRFGMNPYLDLHSIVKADETIKLNENFIIKDIIPLKNGKELITYNSDLIYNDNNIQQGNSSLPIATAITAGARVYMSYFKNMDTINLLYSDTDSLDINKPLPDKYVGTELGQFKLEHIFDEAVYLAPKLYGGKTSDYEYIKIKGLKNPVSFYDLKLLLKKDIKLESSNEKWYKSLSLGQILVKNEIYTMSVTDNKRILIYDENNNFIDTKPIKLNI